MTEYISVNYAQMESAYQQMQSIAGRMDGRLADLRSKLQRITWVGADAEAYSAAQAQWDRSAADLNQVLNEIGLAVSAAHQNYQSTEQANAGLWR